jgi:amidohydrolase
MVTTTRLHDDIDELLPGLVADRRYLHENPELGCEEFITSAFVTDRLTALGVEEIQTGISVTGVTGLIRGTKPGPGRVVLVRADMDALPILEENDVEYRSKVDGKMHACGHDAHTAILLGLARVLMDRRDQFSGTVKLLFQPSEERGPGGAKVMIEAGVLENPHVDAVFALHMAQDLPLGTISIREGAALASADGFKVTIQGKGGHGAHPDKTVDPVVVGAHLITALQTVVARNVDPIESAVVTVGALHTGKAGNVIPDTAEMVGTVRTLNTEVQTMIVGRLEELVSGLCAAMGATGTLEYQYGVPPTVNAVEAARLVRRVAGAIVGDDKVVSPPPSMGGEDFSFFLMERPGAMFMVGSNNPEKGLIWGHHHPKFDIDEESLAVGLEVMAMTVQTYLDEGFDQA